MMSSANNNDDSNNNNDASLSDAGGGAEDEETHHNGNIINNSNHDGDISSGDDYDDGISSGNISDHNNNYSSQGGELLQRNPLEFVRDDCERNQNTWLRFPTEFIRPAKMCSVNKFVQCVDESFLHHSLHHIPTGPEFVLVGHDSPSLPTHMFSWIWAMTQINHMQSYSQCVVPVSGTTEVTYSKRGRGELVATGIKRRLVISQGWQVDDQLRWEQSFPGGGGTRRESMLMEAVQEARLGQNHYAEVPPIQLMWGIIPVEYSLNGVKVRRIFHVLKTIPAPGFDLMRCLVDIRHKSDTFKNRQNDFPYGSIMQAVQEVINYECNRNLKIVGCFGRSHPLPNPCDVMQDPLSPMNPMAILSPFLVMRKILLQLPTANLSDLIIDGFPRTTTDQECNQCFLYFKSMQTAYRSRLSAYHQAFDRALNGGGGEQPASTTTTTRGGGRGSRGGTIEPTTLPLVLCSPSDECLDNVHCFMNMTFNLSRWLDHGTFCPRDRAEPLRMPQLAIATLTPFQYVAICSVSPAEFIRAHIGDAGEDVDETKLAQKYSQDNGSWGDMPHGGMYRSARDSFRSSLKTLIDAGDNLQQEEAVCRRMSTYQNYLRAQGTIHTQAVLVDLMMSDRVLNCAQSLDRLNHRINEGVRTAFQTEMQGVEAQQQRASFLAYPDMAYLIRLLHTLSFHNKSIRANAVNLTTLWNLLVSDVLTHLGSHHETWSWMMYTVQVMGGAGHLRAHTDDHSSKIHVVFTSKPNSVGFNAVITKMFKAFSTSVSELLPDLNSDFLESLRYMKLDRTTRSGVEGVSSVMFVNGMKEGVPSRKTFMRPIIMDEGYRSMDAAALNGLVCSIPRDSDGGSGNILKSVDPGKSGGAHLQGHQRQIPGLSPFLMAMTSNSNPHTAVVGESIKTFSCVTANFPSGAQPGGRLSQLHAGRKRKIADYQASNTNASSTLPMDKRGREELAWIMCVLQMATRQLALLNKTGQVDFELNVISRCFTEWIRNIVQLHFQSFFGATLFLSYDRAIGGYVTRQVATTFMATCARHYAECDNVTDANTCALLDMETAPLTVMSTNLAICNGLTHLVDTNLIMVNQIIREKLSTPILTTEFLVSLFDEAAEINMASGPFEEIFGWVSQVVQCRDGNEFNMGYIAIPKLGTPEDYNAKESYLESYYGIAKGNYFTYNMAVRECSAKSFDLSGFLNMEASMLDFYRFLGRLGVSFDGAISGSQMMAGNNNHNNPFLELYRTTYIFLQSANSGGPDPTGGGGVAGGGAPPSSSAANGGGGHHHYHGNNNNNAGGGGGVQQQQQQPAASAATRSAGIGKCWVSMIQHLLVTSIQGRSELHADNMFSFGANLTEFILSRCAPLQATPAQQMIYESYRHVNDDVLPLRTFVSNKRPEYFVRTINDHGALEYGLATELPAMLGAHPPEDVMHLGSWIQLYTILNAGAKPTQFQCFPDYNGRPPELVCGRMYPLLGQNPDETGTLCLAPGGRSGACFFAISRINQRDGTRQSEVQPLLDVRDWFKSVVKGAGFMVAPLVFRRHAVFRSPNNPIATAVPFVAINFATPGIPEGVNASRFQRYDGAGGGQATTRHERQFLSYKGEYVLSRGIRGEAMMTVHFTDAHERLVPLGTFMLVEKDAIRHFGLGCSKNWLRGSLRYPEEVEPDEDEHQYHIYITVRVKTRTGDQTVRVIHVHVKHTLIMEGSGISQSDVCLEACPSIVQLNHQNNYAGGGGAVM